MKGFTITPILFIGLFMITGIALLNIFDINTRLSNSVNRESRLNNIYYDFLENKTETETLLLYVSARAIATSTTKSGIQTYIQTYFPEAEINTCHADYFIVEYPLNFRKTNGEIKIERNALLKKNVTCEFMRDLGHTTLATNCITSC